jgi:TetR/AcrR family transcriptional regulator, cholesterol catabolism regulator
VSSAAQRSNRTRRVVSNIKNARKIEDRRDLLVAAAIKIFLKQGFHAATVREIGDAAGLTQGTIYNYVRSKDDILYLVCDKVVTAYQAAIREAIDQVDDPSALLESTIRAIVQAMYDHQDSILLIYREGHALDRRALRAILARVGAFHDFVDDVLRDAINSNGIKVENRWLTVNIITFLPTIMALRQWNLRHKVPHEAILQGLTAFLLRGLGATKPAGARRTKRSS